MIAARPTFPVIEARERPAHGDHTVLDEAGGKRLLRAHGVPVPTGAVCSSADAAVGRGGRARRARSR